MTKIVITRPPSPLPPLQSPARKWRRREEWTAEPDERDPAASSSDADGFAKKIRELLGVRP